jgi:hypothetical protein
MAGAIKITEILLLSKLLSLQLFVYVYSSSYLLILLLAFE